MSHFLRLGTLADVTEMLWADGPVSALIAGGTDLLVRPERLAAARIIIDIGQIEELRGVGMDDRGRLRIGAAMTHQDIADDPVVRRAAHILGQACAQVGSFQIRNRGTLGGNLANASPAGDSIPALLCLEAAVALSARERTREVPIAEFFLGPGRTAMQVDEVIESVRIPVRRGRQVSFFEKAGQRKGMCCSKASVAFLARRHSGRRLGEVRVALGAVAPTAIRVPEAEAILEGQILTVERARAAAEACRAAARAIDDIRSTREYRRDVVGALLLQGLLPLFDRMRALERSRRSRRSRRR